jgi:hypothetical protein
MAMKLAIAFAAFAAASPLAAETNLERGKRVVDQSLEALGGARFLAMEDRIESGRAYSFFRERLSGLSLAKIYTRYLTRPEPPVPEYFGVRERQAFGKKQDTAVLFSEEKGWDITFRGARPLDQKLVDRYRESTLRSVFYILRQRLGEPGLIFESKGTDVVDNQPVEIVDIVDGGNRVVTVHFHATTHLPTQQVYIRRDPVTKDQIEELSVFTKYRDVGGGVMWPFTILRKRNGEKIFEIFSDSVTINQDLRDNIFTIDTKMKILKPAR